MKKILILAMVLSALLCGCGQKEEIPQTTAEPTTEATTEPITEPTTVPTTEPAPVYTNPLTGAVVEEPFTRRVFGFTIGNTRDAFPHYGVSKADILFESFVNGLTTRRFAMYSDVRNVESVGGVRSMRIQWTDLCQGYDAVGVHAAGSGYVMGDMHSSGIDNIYAEQWDADFHYRDKDRMRKGYSMEHCLYVRGADLVSYAESQGIRVIQEPDRDYGMRFSETPSSKDGEKADKMVITFKLSGRKKLTTMTYDPVSGCYGMSQYEDIPMTDGYYDNAPELYKNVFALMIPYHSESGIYHVAETVGEGEGYYACNGRMLPIKWYRDSNESAFRFTLMDGTTLEQGIGNNYIAILPVDSEVTWEDLGLPETAEAPTEATEETTEAAETAETGEAEAAMAENDDVTEETGMEETETAETEQSETEAPSEATEAATKETYDLSDVEVAD